jgi:hypothetical protein
MAVPSLASQPNRPDPFLAARVADSHKRAWLLNQGCRQLTPPRSRRHAWSKNALMVKSTRAFFFPKAAREYLYGSSCVRPRSESRLRRTTEALLGSSKRSQEPQAHNLLFQIRYQPTNASAYIHTGSVALVTNGVVSRAGTSYSVAWVHVMRASRLVGFRRPAGVFYYQKGSK